MDKPQGDEAAKQPELSIADGDSLKGKYPAGIRWDAKISRHTLLTLLDRSLEEHGPLPFSEFMGRQMDYAEAGRLIDAAARGLQEQGIGKGDKVGLCMANSPYYPIMFFAALKTGATVVNFNPTYAEEKLKKLAQDSGTKTMIALDLKQFYPKIRNLQKDGTLTKTVICPMGGMMPFFTRFGYNYLSGKRARIDYGAPGTVKFDDLVKGGGKPAPVQIGPDDLAVLQYTGGTTGMPKAAMLTHFNLASNALQVSSFFGVSPFKPDHPSLLRPGKERILGVLPFFHVFGLQISMISAINLGAEMVIVPDPRNIKSVLKTIHKEGPTLFPTVPRLLQAMAEYKKLKKYNLKSLRLAVSGGAALSVPVREAFEKATGCNIVQGYGLSETSPVASAEPPYGPRDKASVGLPMPGTQFRITDALNPTRILPLGEMGEIQIKGPQVMQGYFNDAAETGKVMTADGWFRTGDLGRMGEDRVITITDRLKRLIIVNGFNVYPFQVENAIAKHPAVAECVVVKIPDARIGEAAKAFIRYHADAKDKPTGEQMRAFLAQHLSDTEIPRAYEIWDKELPKTDIGIPDFKKLEQIEKEKFEAAQKAKAPGNPGAKP
jgi:long-chain acyl-CoA synthetase